MGYFLHDRYPARSKRRTEFRVTWCLPLRLPADSLLPGQTPVQEARWSTRFRMCKLGVGGPNRARPSIFSTFGTSRILRQYLIKTHLNGLLFVMRHCNEISITRGERPRRRSNHNT